MVYRQAAAALKRFSSNSKQVGQTSKLDLRWSAAGTEVQQWVLSNREALALYREAAEKPDALELLFGSNGRPRFTVDLDTLQRLALLEASRLEEQGDMAGAGAGIVPTCARSTWPDAPAHSTCGTRASRGTRRLLDRLTGWSAARRTTPTLLRQALDEVIVCEAIVPSDSYALKDQYLLEARFFEDGKRLLQGMPPAWLMSLASRPSFRFLAGIVTPEHIKDIAAAWMFWRSEPERSRRVLRLVTANRLAYYDLPPERRPKPDPDVSSCDLYSFGPEAAAGARVMSAGRSAAGSIPRITPAS